MSEQPRDTGSMVEKTVRLDQSTAAAVRMTAAADNVAESELMARAIDDYLMRRAVANLNAYVDAVGRDALLEEHRRDDAV
jgi:hypothetical protein